MIDVVSVVGARPQFVKLAPLSRALGASTGFRHRVLHTGQHYDDLMSKVFFEQLDLPRPDKNLEIGSGAHGEQTALMMIGLEREFTASRPEAVLVYGDTNSTLAATIAATKMHIPVAHVEAGLRSFNRQMPEEINRLVADHCADRLYAPTPEAMRNLDNENLSGRSFHCGDVMRDAVKHNLEIARDRSTVIDDLKIGEQNYALLTVHRPVNTTPEALAIVLQSAERIARDGLHMIFPMHPRTRAIYRHIHPVALKNLQIIEPLPYLDMLVALENAAFVLTDSGGVQKEAAFVETPCITLRRETEWVETLELGINRLVERDTVELYAAYREVSECDTRFDDALKARLDEIYGSGDAAAKIVEDLSAWLG